MSTWIFLRGLTRESRHWGTFPDQLREALGHPGSGHRMSLIDLPGNGAEYRVTTPLTVTDMVRFVRTRAADAGLSPPYRLVAMSLGGMVATNWAQHFSEEIDRLVLINTSMRPFSAMHERLRPSAWPALMRAALAWSDPVECEAIIHGVTSNRRDTRSHDVASWAAIRRDTPVRAANGLRQLWAAARFRAERRTPVCPTLLLSSKADGLVNPICSARIASAWGATHTRHPWAGHDLPHDDPLWTGNAIATWLNTIAISRCAADGQRAG